MVSIVRNLGLAGVFGITAGATASFDLILQSDFDANLGAHIDRYDPVSRVYLGSFAINSTPGVMTASHVTKRVYVTSGNRVDEFDYSTGAMLRSYGVSSPVAALKVSSDGSTLFVLNPTSIRSYNLSNLSLTTTTLTGATNAVAFERLADGRFVVADEGTGTWRLYNSSTLLSSTAFVNHATLGDLSLRPDSTSSTLALRGSDGTISLRGVNVIGNSLSASATIVSNVNNTTATTSAHQGMYAVGISASTPTQLRAQYILPSGGSGYGFNLNQTTSLTGRTAIVLAPEPGTLVAVGLGVATLLRRRVKLSRR